MPRLLLGCLCLLLGSAALLPGQRVAGVVHGFDDKPVACVVVVPLDERGQRLRELLTAADGTFDVEFEVPIQRLFVQYDAVHLEVPVPAADATRLRIEFAKVAHFTVRGQLLDPGGAAAPQVDLVCRDAAGHAIVTTTTDARGRFEIRANQPLHDMLVDPAGWRHVEPGPFLVERGLAIDLRLVRDRYFCLRGTIVDAAGKPLPDVHVQALGGDQRTAWTLSGPAGEYALWSNRAITMLAVTDGFPRMERVGQWRADSRVDLDERHHGFVIVTGQLLEADGRGADGFAVYAAPRPTRPANLEMPKDRTGGRGEFCVRVPRHVRHLWFCSRPEADGPVRECGGEIVPGEHVIVRLPR